MPWDFTNTVFYIFQLWLHFWGAGHGPVFTTQPDLTLDVLAQFHSEVLHQRAFNNTPVWKVMKDQQDVFNGFGAQEATDALFDALIHPRMPISLICKDDSLWTRFSTTATAHQTFRVNRIMHPELLGAKSLPYISKSKFHMNFGCTYSVLPGYPML